MKYNAKLLALAAVSCMTADAIAQDAVVPTVTGEDAQTVPYGTLEALDRGEAVYINRMNRTLIMSAIHAVTQQGRCNDPDLVALVPKLTGLHWGVTADFGFSAVTVAEGNEWAAMLNRHRQAGYDWGKTHLGCTQNGKDFVKAVVRSINAHGLDAYEPKAPPVAPQQAKNTMSGWTFTMSHMIDGRPQTIVPVMRPVIAGAAQHLLKVCAFGENGPEMRAALAPLIEEARTLTSTDQVSAKNFAAGEEYAKEWITCGKSASLFLLATDRSINPDTKIDYIYGTDREEDKCEIKFAHLNEKMQRSFRNVGKCR